MITTDVTPVSRALARVLDVADADATGSVADYIPELANVDPEASGLVIVSVEGHAYQAGDAEVGFTIQSVSKPFVYALALAEHGESAVHGLIGLEPSGQAFNAISLDERGRPANPMINAGAIVTSALIGGDTPEQRFEAIRAGLSGFAGRELALDAVVYESEARTGHRNRALASLTLASGVLPRGVDDATDVYFRQCSLTVTCADLAVMGATLANDGVNPLTGVSVVEHGVARRTLSLMGSCGMYDRSGEWAFRVGMPAKSGVGGGIVAVTPGQFGVGVFSPRLDAAGNSRRGVVALTMLAEEYGLHLLEHPSVVSSPVSHVHIVQSALGPVLEVIVRGELDFATTERLIYDTLIDDSARVLHGFGAERPVAVHLDLAAVTAVAPVAHALLNALVERSAEYGLPPVTVTPK